MHKEIEPFYFGPSDTPLFGCYHIPQTTPIRNCGVICCYPIGYEYIRFHRAFRQLADRLTKIGFPVLRFDFYGCGDSSGEQEQGQIDRWHQDISIAIDEIKKKARVANICLIGLRLGGALATIAGADRHDVDGMVLWDPVITGTDYLQEMKTLHEEMLRYAHVQPTPVDTHESSTEILGYPLTDAFIANLQRLELLTIPQKPAQHILLIQSHQKVGQERFSKHLQNAGAIVESRRLPAPHLWIWEEAFGKVQVPHQILQSIVSWISEVFS